MSKTKARKKVPVGLLNTASSLLLQIFTIISGFIIPRLILGAFGSETNGLVSSLNQFLNYVTLLEGGLNSVIMASLYKPLAQKDTAKVSSVVKTSTRFFRRISYVFIGYAIILAKRTRPSRATPSRSTAADGRRRASRTRTSSPASPSARAESGRRSTCNSGFIIHNS